jgi:phosphohistidine phosphatase
MRKIARGLTALNVRVDLILTSPYTRARQTAEILGDALSLPAGAVIATEHLAMGCSVAALLGEIKTRAHGAESVALVGHEPFVGELASALLTGNPDMRVNFKKGGVCALTVEKLSQGRCATLEWLLTPSQLAALGVEG